MRIAPARTSYPLSGYSNPLIVFELSADFQPIKYPGGRYSRHNAGLRLKAPAKSSMSKELLECSNYSNINVYERAYFMLYEGFKCPDQSEQVMRPCCQPEAAFIHHVIPYYLVDKDRSLWGGSTPKGGQKVYCLYGSYGSYVVVFLTKRYILSTR